MYPGSSASGASPWGEDKLLSFSEGKLRWGCWGTGLKGVLKLGDDDLQPLWHIMGRVTLSFGVDTLD